MTRGGTRARRPWNGGSRRSGSRGNREQGHRPHSAHWTPQVMSRSFPRWTLKEAAGRPRSVTTSQPRHHFGLPAKPDFPGHTVAQRGLSSARGPWPRRAWAGEAGVRAQGPCSKRGLGGISPPPFPQQGGGGDARSSEMRDLGLPGAKTDCFRGQQAPSRRLQAQA